MGGRRGGRVATTPSPSCALAPASSRTEQLLDELRDDIDARFEYEVQKATGTLLDDDPPPELSVDSIQRQLGLYDRRRPRFPDGYYQSQDGKVLVVAIRSA
ncbi:MAG: hypothetical protein U0441_30025 [Polyangiaceae bacterium]